MGWAAAWALVKRFWPFGVMAALAILCLHLNSRATHWHDQASLCAQARKTDEANYRAASAKASNENKATVLATERKWQAVVADKDRQYNATIASANASVANYVDRMRNQTAAYRRSLAAAGVSPASFPASGANGAGEATLVPVSDLNVCAENTVKAQTWQDFWKGIVTSQPSRNGADD